MGEKIRGESRMRTALIAGATGLIGKQLLNDLLASSYYDVIKAVTRKPVGITHPKLINIVTDFDDLQTRAEALKADDVFCCLGTTIRQAGSQKQFRKVDYDYPVTLAEVTKAEGASQYLLVSALGAKASSSIFYNRVKGETEQAIRNVGFDALHIFRPSLLLGERTEHRAGEEAAKKFYSFFNWLFPKKYKGIEGRKVARAMVEVAGQSRKGMFVYESAALQDY